MNCCRGNYCTDMIKLIGVFDKVLRLNSSEKDDSHFIQDMIIDEISSIDERKLYCPYCGATDVEWKRHQSCVQPIIWNNPDKAVEVSHPQFSFRCRSCHLHGSSLITTDIAIDRTRLSYHYVFRLIHNVTYESDKNIVERDNLLYGKLSEESLKRWERRYRRDFGILRTYAGDIAEKDLLTENVNFTELFHQFFMTEHRFFLHNSPVRIILSLD